MRARAQTNPHIPAACKPRALPRSGVGLVLAALLARLVAVPAAQRVVALVGRVTSLPGLGAAKRRDAKRAQVGGHEPDHGARASRLGLSRDDRSSRRVPGSHRRSTLERPKVSMSHEIKNFLIPVGDLGIQQRSGWCRRGTAAAPTIVNH